MCIYIYVYVYDCVCIYIIYTSLHINDPCIFGNSLVPSSQSTVIIYGYHRTRAIPPQRKHVQPKCSEHFGVPQGLHTSRQGGIPIPATS